MAVQAIAVVNSEGAIESAYVPGAIYPEDGATDEHDSSRTIRHINSDIIFEAIDTDWNISIGKTFKKTISFPILK